MSIIGRNISPQYPGAAVGLDSLGGDALFDGDGHAGQKALAGIFIKLSGLLYCASLWPEW